MNYYTEMNSRIKVGLFALLCIFLISCGKWIVPPELVGQWKTNKHKITVRTSPEKGKYNFTSDSATITITINSDKTVIGSIGNADFVNGIIKKNWGNPERSGLICIIKCGSIGKIFENDPIDNKEVQLWLSPMKEEGVMEAELRYTEGSTYFPMAGVTFTKKNDK